MPSQTQIGSIMGNKQSFPIDSTYNLQTNWQKHFCTKVDSIIKNSKLCQRSEVGMYFYDLTKDSDIYSYGAKQLMRPASVMKTLTAITALSELGGSYQYVTRLYKTGEIKDSVLNGNLYVVAGFDPRFDSEDMESFIKALKEKGIYKINGNIYTDLSLKDTLTLGNGWLWHWRADEKPLTPLLYNSKDCFMTKFFKNMDDEGIIHPKNYNMAILPKKGITLLTTCTHTIDQILMRMLKQSDNLYAESLFYQLGARDHIPYASAKQSARYIYNFIHKNLHENPNYYTIADGSGLSVYDYVSPQLIVKTLKYAFHNNNIFLHFYPALPIAGEDGTLKSRMKGGSADENVHAKTGSVKRIVTLAGYCKTPDEHDIAFAIFHQGITSSSQAHYWDDKILNLLTTP